MITYELAKQLKEAGFPQDVWKFDLCNFAYNEVGELHLLHNDNDEGGNVGNDYLHREKDKIDWTRCPTLSELIEACGDNFYGLLQEYPYHGHWVAGKDWNYSDFGDVVGRGSTPEEAVANLWLVLNKHE